MADEGASTDGGEATADASDAPQPAPRRRRRASTSRQVLIVFVVVGLYSAFLFRDGVRSSAETFPVFRWELFSKVPSRVRTDYGVRIVAWDGRDLFFPRYYEQATDMVSQPRSVEASTMTRSMGANYDAGNTDRAEDIRRRYEDRFLNDTPVRYELVRRTYDVKGRLDCNCYVREVVIGTFRAGGAP